MPTDCRWPGSTRWVTVRSTGIGVAASAGGDHNLAGESPGADQGAALDVPAVRKRAEADGPTATDRAGRPGPDRCPRPELVTSVVLGTSLTPQQTTGPQKPTGDRTISAARISADGHRRRPFRGSGRTDAGGRPMAWTGEHRDAPPPCVWRRGPGGVALRRGPSGHRGRHRPRGSFPECKIILQGST